MEKLTENAIAQAKEALDKSKEAIENAKKVAKKNEKEKSILKENLDIEKIKVRLLMDQNYRNFTTIRNKNTLLEKKAKEIANF